MSVRPSFVVAVATAVMLVHCALAGPLDPPAGPIVPTYKTLAEIEPRMPINATTAPGDVDSVYRIASPGSYYLTASFIAPAGKSAIEIAASNVTIDLGGFTITSLATLDAIRLSIDSRSNISIRNGNIGTCLGGGIDIKPNIGGATVTVGGAVENVHVANTTGVGILLGDSVVVCNVTAAGCGNSGIDARNSCRFTDCVATGNAIHGVRVLRGCSFSGCVMSENLGDGITTAGNASIHNCTFRANGSYGCLSGSGSVLTDSVAYLNDDFGFYLSGNSTITGCSAYDNGTAGIFAQLGGSVITSCGAFSNGSHGIETGSNAVVTFCSATSNGGSGIYASIGCEVIACVANSNALDGVRCDARSLIKDCTCRGNGAGAAIGVGVHADGAGNRIEGNHCAENDFGIDIDVAGNVIVRNTCSGNTQNFVIAPDNIYGTIADRTSPGTPAVIGNAAAGTMGSNDPSANFAH